jgi:hypothetical protein
MILLVGFRHKLRISGLVQVWGRFWGFIVGSERVFVGTPNIVVNDPLQLWRIGLDVIREGWGSLGCEWLKKVQPLRRGTDTNSEAVSLYLRAFPRTLVPREAIKIYASTQMI